MIRVVFAIQAPTLLNRLKETTKWRLEVADLGDATMAERSRLAVPRYAGGDVHAVFVTTPAQLWGARFRWPGAKLVWVAHNGRPAVIDPAGRGLPILAFSKRVARLQKSAQPGVPVAAIRPAYEPEPIWSWKKDLAWLMLSRPDTRQPDLPEANRYVLSRSGVTCRMYGEGQPDGFLADPRTVMRSCSAYLSALPHWAGFGLSQHECFAAGVPVVCSRWGDTAEEISADYEGLNDDLDNQAAALMLCATNQAFARLLSRLGLEYITQHRTPAAMDREIEQALDTL